MVKKKSKKLMYSGISILLLLVVVGLFYTFSNNNDNSIVNDERYVINGSVILEQPDLDKIDILKRNLNDLVGFQVFTFTDALSKDYKTVSYLRTSPYVYQHISNGIDDKIGNTCKVGEYIRLVECSTSSNTNVFNPGFNCPKDLFNNMWYISKNGDYPNLGNFYTKSLDFNYMYMCYKSETPTTPDTSTSSLSGNKNSKYGYFDNVNIPKITQTNDKIVVTGTFIPYMDYNGLLIETAINQQSFQPLSVSQSDKSACDGSKMFASKFVNVKKGVPVEFKFTLNTASRDGKFNVDLYAVKGCYNDVGPDAELQKNIWTEQITINKRSFDNSNDWDKDDVPNTPTLINGEMIYDNCPYTYNPKQYDVDGDDVGDECDFCPLDVGINAVNPEKYYPSYYLGCHPCEGLAETDECWDKTYPDKIFTDPRYNVNGSVSGEGENYKQTFDEYLDELIRKAEADLTQDCIGKGYEYWEDGICKPEKITPTPTPTPTPTKTDEDRCNEQQFVWDGSNCIDPSILEKDVCENTGGVWNNEKCEVNVIPENYYCGDNICSLDEDKTSCPIDCNFDKTCSFGEVNMISCPDGKQIVGEVCINNIFEPSREKCDISGDEGFIQKNIGVIGTASVVLLGILGAVFLL